VDAGSSVSRANRGLFPDAPGPARGVPTLAASLFPTGTGMVDNHAAGKEGTMPLLDDAAVEKGLKRLPGWERRGNEIVKTFVRRDFMGAISFVHEVADAAEAAGHHPDIDIRWNKVTLALCTHAQGGLTESDFELAARIDELGQPTLPFEPH